MKRKDLILLLKYVSLGLMLTNVIFVLVAITTLSASVLLTIHGKTFGFIIAFIILSVMFLILGFSVFRFYIGYKGFKNYDKVKFYESGFSLGIIATILSTIGLASSEGGLWNIINLVLSIAYAGIIYLLREGRYEREKIEESNQGL